MPRRRLIAIVSAVALLAIMLAVGAAVVMLTGTRIGHDYVRNKIVSLLSPGVHGKLYVGRIDGNYLSWVSIDSVELRDANDSIFVATGKITIRPSVFDLLDRRTLVRRIDIDHPVVYMRRDSTGQWNWKKIFPGDTTKKAKGTPNAFAQYIVIHGVGLKNGSFILSMPWHPNDTLRGAQRDSAIRYALTRKDKETRRSGSGFLRTYRWTGIGLDLSYARIAHPDSVGRAFTIKRLDVDESDPPFAFRNVRGGVDMLGDSLWADVTHFDLPASTGSGKGKVVWGSNLPTRYDLRIVGDSVSLADVSWVYPTLPTKGGGSMVLNIKNERNLDVLDYALSEMDVRTTRSRLRGKMTFGVGAPVLIVKDLDVVADPVDFDLLRTFAGEPFPYDWQGQLIGTVKARGGPLNRFAVDDAQLTFRDAHVPGATSRIRGRGELDILYPAFTKFRGFAVDAEVVDLRTIEFLNPNFPRIGGTIAGRVTLDSSWLDVRFRNADITHRDGPAEPTHMLGSGRVTFADDFLRYDLALNAAPLSFTALGRSYPDLRIRGPYTGPLRIEGTLEDLAVTAELTGAAGTVAFDGRVDAYPPGYRLQGSGRVAGLDLRTLLDTASMPITSLNAAYSADIAGDSLANLVGSLAVDLERSLIDSVRFFPSRAKLAFGNEHLRIDSLRLETAAATLVARGGLGLARGVADSLVYEVTVDSLGGLRRYLGTPPPPARPVLTANGVPAPPNDSLGGTLVARGTAVGNVDSIGVRGVVSGGGLWVRGDRADSLDGRFDATLVDTMLTGTFAARLDTIITSGMRIAQASVVARARSKELWDVAVNAVSATGPQLLASGGVRLAGDTTLVTLDSLRLDVAKNRWQLARASRVVATPLGVAIDPIELRGPSPAVLHLAGTIPKSGAVILTLRGDSLPLSDIGVLQQSPVTFGGTASVAANVTGTRDDPLITAAGTFQAPQFGDVRLDRLTLSGDYRAKQLKAQLGLVRGGAPVLSANLTLPLDLALRDVAQRRLDAPLAGVIRSDSVDLGLVEAFSPSIKDAKGKFIMNLDLGGTWDRPVLRGAVGVTRGELVLATLGDVRFTNIFVDLGFSGDSVAIRRAVMRSAEDQRADSLWLTGWVNIPEYDDIRSEIDPRFDVFLHARNFHAIEKPRVAHLDVSSDLHLSGRLSSSELTGGVTVERGAVYIPELYTKELVSLDDAELYKVVDTTVFANRNLLPKAPPKLVQNLSVTGVNVNIGDDVWLRSAEANIKLGGALNVRVGPTRGGVRTTEQLALEGNLLTTRGTYRLNIGGILQRSFDVENGKISFYSDADFNPTLDINAVHTIRQFTQTSQAFSRPDVRIRVHIGGTLVRPQLTLSSADSLNISESDLISYLVTGAPSFAVGGQSNEYTSLASRIFLSTASAYLSDFLRGNFFDVVTVQTGVRDRRNGQSDNGFSQVFKNARFGLGKQVTDRTFVSVNAGLCPFVTGNQSATGTDPLSFADYLGFSIEQRFNGGFGASIGLDPKNDALLCATGGQTGRAFPTQPKQWGLDFFKTWRF